MTNTTGLSILVAFIIELFVVTKAYHAYVPHLPIIYNEGSGTYRTVFAFSYVHCKELSCLFMYNHSRFSVRPYAPAMRRAQIGMNLEQA